MLTLLEPPGGKQTNRSAQLLLTLGGPGGDEEEYYDYDVVNEDKNDDRGIIATFLENWLVGKSNADEYSERWKNEFRCRPSWCDADLCLQQIRRRKAVGNRWALYARSFVQKCLFSLGNTVQSHAWTVIAALLIIFTFCCYGLQFVRIETDIVKLWVSKGGRLDEELSFHERVRQSANYNHTNNEVPRENGLGGGYQVVIQTPEFEGQNILNRESLLKHVQIMREIANITVDVHGLQWTLSDLCFKPASPELEKGSMAVQFGSLIDRIIPCIWITPIDCFWDGAKALGPHPPIQTSEMGLLQLLSSIPSTQNVTWKVLDPTAVIEEIQQYANLGSHATFFKRAGISHGYLDRPCMDPLDEECPAMAPNYYDTCKNSRVEKWISYMNSKGLPVIPDQPNSSGFDILSILSAGRKKRSPVDDSNATNVTGRTAKVIERFGELPTVAPTAPPTPPPTTQSPADRKKFCKEHHGPMLRWMAENRDSLEEVLGADVPMYPDYASVMAKGCPGFARDVLHWPVDMIVGATENDEKGRLARASALQSVFLVASPNDVFLRFSKGAMQNNVAKKGLNMTAWSSEMAEEVIVAWQRNFTHMLYGHKENFVEKDGVKVERRTIHPLASTSIADMLEEFCQFNYTIILVGYGLMLVYAMLTQLRMEGGLPATHSCAGLAFAGVLTVTYASIAGLGFATWFGIEFNAATTQIVPFLTLGIGVDNMFMLLHNYHDVIRMTKRNEMGMLLRETGMSILCTSINNILSFLAGTLLPIPALRSFCAQSSILLTFNFIAILTIYPAVISLDLRRRNANRRDILCCLATRPVEDDYTVFKKAQVPEKKTIGSEPSSYRNLLSKQVEVEDEREIIPYTLHAALRNYYIPLIASSTTKVLVIAFSVVLVLFAVVGMRRANIGLELSDVLPEHTAPAAFLKARDSYFSFYPMFAVLKGSDIDLAKQQHMIENYRNAIGASKYVVKSEKGEPSEKYWLEMMRGWLKTVQAALDLAIQQKLIDVTTGEVVVNGSHPGQAGMIDGIKEDALTGYRLVCSVGEVYSCRGRVGRIRLVDDSDTINEDGFYNYLTAWFNQDNMMYYVTQASFFPNPPHWDLKDNTTKLVPPAMPLSYSQIPFYLTGLTTTPVIVEVIKEIRAICDNYTAQGLPNFPQGIAFTFWEQYLHLNGNLLQAIGVIALAVFVVLSVLLFNPWAAGSILLILITMTVQLAGFLGWAGIKLNPVSAVTLITAVGIGVEFTAHVVLAFLTSLGNRQERMASAVDRVFVPVIHGALSTLLGILMLAFSEFEFVVKYFFVVMSALIVIGLINGLVLLPVLLSLIGPPTEVRPLDNKRRLPLPPSSRRMEAVEMEDEEGGGLTMYGRM